MRKKRSNFNENYPLAAIKQAASASGGTEIFWTGFSIHMVVSTYTSGSVTRGIWNILTDQKIVPAYCEG